MTEPLATPPHHPPPDIHVRPGSAIHTGAVAAADTRWKPSPHPGPSPTADTEPQTSQRQALMMFSEPAQPEHRLAAKELFGRHFRGGLIVVPYAIGTRFIKQFYKRNFVFLSQSMHTLDNYRHIRGVDQALLDQSEAELAGCLDDTLETLRQAREQARTMVAQQGAPDLPMNYPQGVTLDVPIISPTAGSYMAILCAADEAFSAVEKCWLLGLTDFRTRKAQEKKLRQSLHLVSAAVRRCRTAMGDHVRSILPQSEAPSRLVHVVTNPEMAAVPGSIDHRHTGLHSDEATASTSGPPPSSAFAPAPIIAAPQLKPNFRPMPDAA